MNERARPEAVAEPPVLLSVEAGVARLTMNRPKQYNAISRGMLDAMHSALEDIARDRRIRAVVVAGNGPAFSGGHDLKEMMACRTEEFIGGLFDACSRVMLAMAALPQPVVARVHGTATAAGCQLVAACDLAVAASDARFATSGINFGLFCATPGVPLSRNLSRKRAFEMLFTGEFIDAATALQWGLVNRVVPVARLEEATLALARTLAAKPPAVVAAGKQSFYSQLERPLADAYAEAAACITRNMLGPDAAEGVSAFIDKRAPRWEQA